MQQITNKIETTIYGYETGKFIPIFIDGKLANRDEFISYKAGRAFDRVKPGLKALLGQVDKLIVGK